MTTLIKCCDNLDFLNQIETDSVKLVVTSPPYNIGKEYEGKPISIYDWLDTQKEVVSECLRVLHPQGSICWQVGNHIDNGEILPLDILLYRVFSVYGAKLRNRIIWHFEHGLHCSKRLSGRYETIMWFTKTDDYTFNLDPIRVPSKYPNKKHFKGLKKVNCLAIRLVKIRQMFGAFLMSNITTLRKPRIRVNSLWNLWSG